MRLVDVIEMSVQNLRDAEYLIEWLFKDLSLDVVWTTHFVDRVLGREDNVRKEELIDAFRKLKQKYSARLMYAKDKRKEFVGVLKDLSTELNIPFSIDFSRKNPRNHKYVFRGITIMRKDPKRFNTNVFRGQELRVESVDKLPVDAQHSEEERPSQKLDNSKKKRKFKWKSPQEARTKLIQTLWGL